MLHLPTPPAVNLMSSTTPRAWPPRAASLGTVSINATCLLVSVLGNELFPVSSVSLSPLARLGTYFHFLPFVVHEHTSLEVKGVASFIFSFRAQSQMA